MSRSNQVKTRERKRLDLGHGAYAQQIGDVLKGLQKGVGGGSTGSNTDIVNGLKEALQIGTIGPFRTLCRGLHL